MAVPRGTAVHGMLRHIPTLSPPAASEFPAHWIFLKQLLLFGFFTGQTDSEASLHQTAEHRATTVSAPIVAPLFISYGLEPLRDTFAGNIYAGRANVQSWEKSFSQFAVPESRRCFRVSFSRKRKIAGSFLSSTASETEVLAKRRSPWGTTSPSPEGVTQGQP